MESKNTDYLENIIRDRLADDPTVCDLIEDDDDFEHVISLIQDSIDEWRDWLRLTRD